MGNYTRSTRATSGIPSTKKKVLANWPKRHVTGGRPVRPLWVCSIQHWRNEEGARLTQPAKGSRHDELKQQISIQDIHTSKGEYGHEQSTCFSKMRSKRTIVTIKRRTRKKSHSDWALGQAVSAELHLGRFSNWTGGGPEQPDQPWKQCCFKQDTGPGEHPHHLNVPWLYYTPNAKSYWRHGHLISIIHTKDRQTDNHIVNTTSCARLENMNLWRMWGESLGCPKLEQPNS